VVEGRVEFQIEAQLTLDGLVFVGCVEALIRSAIKFPQGATRPKLLQIDGCAGVQGVYALRIYIYI
jgi:hypothetical protein